MGIADDLHRAHKLRQRRINYAGDLAKLKKSDRTAGTLNFADYWHESWCWELVDFKPADIIPPRPAKDKSQPPKVEEIKRAVAKHFRLTCADLESPRRDMDTAYARQIAYYFSRKRTSQSLIFLSGRFGNRDHSTIIHGVRKIEALLQHDPKVAEDVAKIEAML